MTRQDIIADTMAKYWNVRDDLKDRNLDQLKAIVNNDKLPFAVCALNVTGDLNLGIMMRTASLMGAERFIIYGRHNYDRRSTVGAQNYIDIVTAGSVIRNTTELDYSEFYPVMTKFRYIPLFFDTGGEPLTNVDMNIIEHYWKYDGIRFCLVFGNEGLGLPPELTKDQRIVTIPQRGVLRSLNVGAAASIAIHHFSNYFSKIV